MEVNTSLGGKSKFQVKVRGQGLHRLDGMDHLYAEAAGKRVLDIGCNRGLVGLEMAWMGAKLLHGCDIDAEGIYGARLNFADIREVSARFEVVDLTRGPAALSAFADQTYDLTLCLATYHKLKRAMPRAELSDLMRHFGSRTEQFAWRGTSDKHDDNLAEMAALDRDLGDVGLKRVHTNDASKNLGICAVWERG
jgi:SAM-dependent methyltransferase